MKQAIRGLLLATFFISVISCADNNDENQIIYWKIKGTEDYGRTIYRVFPSSQRVVHWDPDDTSGLAIPLENCYVGDATHWTCESGQESVGFGNGKYHNEGTVSYMSYLNAFQWWTHRIFP